MLMSFTSSAVSVMTVSVETGLPCTDI